MVTTNEPLGAGHFLLSNLSRRPLLQPSNVRIIGGWRRRRRIQPAGILSNRWSGSRVEPPLDFSVAVDKRQSASAIVVAGRQILSKFGRVGVVRKAGHIHKEIAPIDRVLAFVPE